MVPDSSITKRQCCDLVARSLRQPPWNVRLREVATGQSLCRPASRCPRPRTQRRIGNLWPEGVWRHSSMGGLAREQAPSPVRIWPWGIHGSSPVAGVTPQRTPLLRGSCGVPIRQLSRSRLCAFRPRIPHRALARQHILSAHRRRGISLRPSTLRFESGRSITTTGGRKNPHSGDAHPRSK